MWLIQSVDVSFRRRFSANLCIDELMSALQLFQRRLDFRNYPFRHGKIVVEDGE